jgi:hypothetical protein
VKVHCDEGVATHIGPEPCAVIREGVGEASVGEYAGQPLSRERMTSRAPTLSKERKATWAGAQTRASDQPGVVVDPGMYRSSLHGNREISESAISPPGELVRSGKARSRSR